MSNSGKMWATLAPLCCVEAPIIIINSLCLLKRNNLITRLDAINIENFVMGIRGVSSAWDEDEGEGESNNVYTNHHHLHTMLNAPFHQSISARLVCVSLPRVDGKSLSSDVCMDSTDVYGFMMEHYSRHYCLIKYWFFIINETWILISRLSVLLVSSSARSLTTRETNLYVSLSWIRIPVRYRASVTHVGHLSWPTLYGDVVCRFGAVLFRRLSSLNTLVGWVLRQSVGKKSVYGGGERGRATIAR